MYDSGFRPGTETQLFPQPPGFRVDHHHTTTLATTWQSRLKYFKFHEQNFNNVCWLLLQVLFLWSGWCYHWHGVKIPATLQTMWCWQSAVGTRTMFLETKTPSSATKTTLLQVTSLFSLIAVDLTQFGSTCFQTLQEMNYLHKRFKIHFWKSPGNQLKK